MNIKDMVSNGKKVTFQYFQSNELWYSTECGFLFPVPTYDIGTARFLNEDKAMLFMRYIRKHIERMEKGESE